MSDVNVVALVPVTGRAHWVPPALLDTAVTRLSALVDRVHVVSEPTEWLDLVGDADVVLVHDPLRAHTPADVVARVVAEVVATGRPVVPVLPCSDTVKRLDAAGVVIDTPDRAELRVLQSPVGYPAAVFAAGLASGVIVPGTVPAGARTVAGDPLARRLASAVDVAMIDGGQA
jgi:hypothetical protein